MNRKWPADFIVDARGRGEGKVWGQEPQAVFNADECANCGGIGFMYAFYVDAGPFKNIPSTSKVLHWVEEMQAYYTGELKAAACPICAGDKRMAWLVQNCNLTDDELDIRMEHFTPMAGKTEARNVALQLLKMTPSPSGYVTFYGEYGVGKTTLLKALVNGFRIAGVFAVYVRMSDLLAEVRETFSDNAKGAAETLIREYKGVKVLAIDEVDRVNLTPWAAETSFRLLDGRWESSSSSLTLLATNKGPDFMDDNLGYLASRMKGGVVVEVGGVDVRPAIGVIARQELREFAP